MGELESTLLFFLIFFLVFRLCFKLSQIGLWLVGAIVLCKKQTVKVNDRKQLVSEVERE